MPVSEEKRRGMDLQTLEEQVLGAIVEAKNDGVNSQRLKERILAALADGEMGDATRLLINALGNPIRWYCAKRLLDKGSVQDVWQETFMQAHRSLGNYRGEAPIETWLFTIARNRCIDHNRKYKNDTKHHVSQKELSADEFINIPDATNEEIIDFLLLAHVRACMKELTRKERLNVSLHHEQGLSHLEISELLGCTDGASRNRVGYCLELIRKCLRRKGIEI